MMRSKILLFATDKIIKNIFACWEKFSWLADSAKIVSAFLGLEFWRKKNSFSLAEAKKPENSVDWITLLRLYKWAERTDTRKISYH